MDIDTSELQFCIKLSERLFVGSSRVDKSGLSSWHRLVYINPWLNNGSYHSTIYPGCISHIKPSPRISSQHEECLLTK